MNEVRTAAIEELYGWKRSLLFWWLLVAAPLFVMWILAGLFGSGAMRDLPIAVCDLDQSPMSREWVRSADALPSMSTEVFVTSPLEGLDKLRQGKVHGVLIIPKHFERDMLRNRAARVTAYVDGQRMPVGSLLQRDLTELGGMIWEKYHIATLERTGIPPRTAKEMSSTLTLDLRSLGNPFVSYKTFLVHGFLPVIIQIVSLVYMTFRIKSLVAPVSFARAVGTILPAAILSWALCCVGALVLWLAGAMIVQCSFIKLFVVYLLFMLVCFFLALFIAGFCDERLQALMFTSGLASPAFAFSGVTFPLESMPIFGRFWASLLPTTHLMKLEVGIAQMDASLFTLLPSVGALLLLGLLFATGSIIFYSRRQAAGVPQ